ncbi:hydrolase, partial [Salmonella enterica subsp. salamae]|nr:hydrolase [Salmonella enterica subsp. salamae]
EILPDMLAEKGIEKTELPQLTTEITTKALRDA